MSYTATAMWNCACPSVPSSLWPENLGSTRWTRSLNTGIHAHCISSNEANGDTDVSYPWKIFYCSKASCALTSKKGHCQQTSFRWPFEDNLDRGVCSMPSWWLFHDATVFCMLMFQNALKSQRNYIAQDLGRVYTIRKSISISATISCWWRFVHEACLNWVTIGITWLWKRQSYVIRCFGINNIKIWTTFL